MRVVMVLLALALAGCVSAEEMAQRQQAADHRACVEMGIGTDNAAYLECRRLHVMARIENERLQAQKSAALMQGGLMMMQMGQPKPAPVVTCNRFGTMTSCF